MFKRKTFASLAIFFESCLEYIFIAISMLILLLSLTYNTFISMDGSEIPNVSLNPVYNIFAFLVVAISLLRLQRYLKIIPSKYIFLVCMLVFTFCGLYLVFNVDLYLRKTDAWACLNAARNLNHHNYLDFQSNFNDLTYKSGYLNIYPYQLYWVSFLRFLIHINDSLRFLYLMNFCFSLVTLASVYMITSFLTESGNIRSNSIILATLFLPLLFNVLFIYNNVVALMLFSVAMLFLTKGLKDKNYCLEISVLLLILSCLLKNNYLIGLIAGLITIALVNLKWKRKILLIVLPIIIIPLSNKLLGEFYTHDTNIKVSLNSGMPKSAYIVMGLNEHQSKSGWYDGSTVRTYQQANYSNRDADIVSKKALKKRIIDLLNHPRDSYRFFKEKIITTWTDATFQSIWNAPLSTWGAKLKTRVMEKIYNPSGDNLTSKFLRLVSQINVWLVVTFSIYWILLMTRSKQLPKPLQGTSLVGILYFIGGFTFHLFWETKAQYMYQYLVLLIPLASFGVATFSDRLRNISFKMLFKGIMRKN